jgi:hypothetical protein
MRFPCGNKPGDCPAASPRPFQAENLPKRDGPLVAPIALRALPDGEGRGEGPTGCDPPSRSSFVARVHTITTRRRNWPAPHVPPIGLVGLARGRRSGLPLVHDRHGQPARVVAVVHGERDDVVVERPRPGVVGREDKVAALPGPRLRCTPYPASSLAPPPRGGATASHRPRARRLLPTGFRGRIPRSPSLVDE